MSIRIRGVEASNRESKWLSVSDLMSGLMMVFLLISIMLVKEAVKIKEAVDSLNTRIDDIAQDLRVEFKDDLARWNAEFVEKTLEFKFLTPDVMFELGGAELKPRFKEILSDFFPRYLRVLEKYKPDIKEIRIEGHTSSEWNIQTSPTDAYFNNMRLSQSRTRSVLQYVYLVPEVYGEEKYRDWVKSNVAAVGLSSSKNIVNKDGVEDGEMSRRVTFRVITNAEELVLCARTGSCR